MFAKQLGRNATVGAAVTIVVAVALRFDWWEGLRGGFGWRWLYSPLPLDKTLLLAAAAIIYVVTAYCQLLYTKRVRWALLWSMFGCFTLGVVTVYIQSSGQPLFELFARTSAPVGTGPQWMAANIDWVGGEWRDWVGIMRRFGGHLSNLPPGSILLYAGLAHVLDMLPVLSQPLKAALLPLQCSNSIKVVITGMMCLVGFGLPWIVFLLVGGQSFVEILTGSLGFHMAIDRQYVPWLVLHTWDWALWNGLPLLMATVMGIVVWIASRRSEVAAEVPTWTITFLLGMMIMVLSGTARGETGRVWTFITPLLLMSFGELVRSREGLKPYDLWLRLAGAQAVLLVALSSTIPTMGTDWRVPVPGPFVAADNAVSASFHGPDGVGRFQLTAWTFEIVEDNVFLRLNWEGVEDHKS